MEPKFKSRDRNQKNKILLFPRHKEHAWSFILLHRLSSCHGMNPKCREVGILVSTSRHRLAFVTKSGLLLLLHSNKKNQNTRTIYSFVHCPSVSHPRYSKNTLLETNRPTVISPTFLEGKKIMMKINTFVFKSPHPQSMTGGFEFSSCQAPGKRKCPAVDSPRQANLILSLPSDCFLPHCDNIEDTKCYRTHGRPILKFRPHRYPSDRFPERNTQTRSSSSPHMIEIKEPEDRVSYRAIRV